MGDLTWLPVLRMMLADANQIGSTTPHDFQYEGIDLLADRHRAMEAALLAARMAGHMLMIIDVPGPTLGRDLLSGPATTTRYDELLALFLPASAITVDCVV